MRKKQQVFGIFWVMCPFAAQSIFVKAQDLNEMWGESTDVKTGIPFQNPEIN
jgi:hypothetical protein